jgi:sugar phosphate isomerase/epimerase
MALSGVRAAARTVFALLDALPVTPYLGVQYDPSNAVIGGFDSIAFLDKVKHRVDTVHASDRFLLPGTTIDDLRLHDGTIGYPDRMVHGETGRGTNDYDAIFRLLHSAGFNGWISVEDGMNGPDELRRSVEFLKRKRAQYYGVPADDGSGA